MPHYRCAAYSNTASRFRRRLSTGLCSMPSSIRSSAYDILIYAFGSARSIRGSGMNHIIATKTYKAQDTQGFTNVRAMATT